MSLVRMSRRAGLVQKRAATGSVLPALLSGIPYIFKRKRSRLTEVTGTITLGCFPSHPGVLERVQKCRGTSCSPENNKGLVCGEMPSGHRDCSYELLVTARGLFLTYCCVPPLCSPNPGLRDFIPLLMLCFIKCPSPYTSRPLCDTPLIPYSSCISSEDTLYLVLSQH